MWGKNPKYKKSIKINEPIFGKKNVECYFDGACEPKNPGGNMGLGAVIKINGEEFCTYSDFVRAHPTNSNNVAEYGALRWVLQTLIKEKLTGENVTIYGDSMMAIRQMQGEWKITSGRYVSYANDCKSMLHLFINIKFYWIPRERNEYADNLSKDNLLANGVEFRIQPILQ